MKDSESKLVVKNSNNISQTHQEILLDLNNLLKNEETDQKGNDKKNKLINEREQIIEEEQTYETHSILKSNVPNNNANKNLKCKL